jgi:hypothetical protein
MMCSFPKCIVNQWIEKMQHKLHHMPIILAICRLAIAHSCGVEALGRLDELVVVLAQILETKTLSVAQPCSETIIVAANNTRLVWRGDARKRRHQLCQCSPHQVRFRGRRRMPRVISLPAFRATHFSISRHLRGRVQVRTRYVCWPCCSDASQAST